MSLDPWDLPLGLVVSKQIKLAVRHNQIRKALEDHPDPIQTAICSQLTLIKMQEKLVPPPVCRTEYFAVGSKLLTQ